MELHLHRDSQQKLLYQIELAGYAPQDPLRGRGHPDCGNDHPAAAVGAPNVVATPKSYAMLSPGKPSCHVATTLPGGFDKLSRPQAPKLAFLPLGFARYTISRKA